MRGPRNDTHRTSATTKSRCRTALGPSTPLRRCICSLSSSPHKRGVRNPAARPGRLFISRLTAPPSDASDVFVSRSFTHPPPVDAQRPSFYLERLDGLYDLPAFVLAEFWADLPLMILFTLLFAVPIYFMAGLDLVVTKVTRAAAEETRDSGGGVACVG